jgi:hypothetical protein
MDAIVTLRLFELRRSRDQELEKKYIMILVASVMRIFCSVILVWLETGSGLAADIPQASRLKPYT